MSIPFSLSEAGFEGSRSLVSGLHNVALQTDNGGRAPTSSSDDSDGADVVRGAAARAEAPLAAPRLTDRADSLPQVEQRPQFSPSAMAYPSPPHMHGPIVAVSCYTCFADLAHGPRGVEAQRSFWTFRLNLNDGTLTLLSAVPKGFAHNPVRQRPAQAFLDQNPQAQRHPHPDPAPQAFTRCHPSLNVVYSCTESVRHEGQVPLPWPSDVPPLPSPPSPSPPSPLSLSSLLHLLCSLLLLVHPCRTPLPLLAPLPLRPHRSSRCSSTRGAAS